MPSQFNISSITHTHTFPGPIINDFIHLSHLRSFFPSLSLRHKSAIGALHLVNLYCLVMRKAEMHASSKRKATVHYLFALKALHQKKIFDCKPFIIIQAHTLTVFGFPMHACTCPPPSPHLPPQTHTHTKAQNTYIIVKMYSFLLQYLLLHVTFGMKR